VATKIILLGDVPMRTNPYTAFVVGVPNRRSQKELVLMSHVKGEAMTTGHVASTRIKLLPRLGALLLQKIAARKLHIDKELWFATRPVAGPRRIAVPTRDGAVMCLVYEPHPNAPLAGGREGRPPIHVQIHPGGFFLGIAEQDDHIDSDIASEVGAAVVNPDYSVAPRV
jgi:acetyl esterase/lipase